MGGYDSRRSGSRGGGSRTLGGGGGGGGGGGKSTVLEKSCGGRGCAMDRDLEQPEVVEVLYLKVRYPLLAPHDAM